MEFCKLSALRDTTGLKRSTPKRTSQGASLKPLRVPTFKSASTPATSSRVCETKSFRWASSEGPTQRRVWCRSAAATARESAATSLETSAQRSETATWRLRRQQAYTAAQHPSGGKEKTARLEGQQKRESHLLHLEGSPRDRICCRHSLCSCRRRRALLDTSLDTHKT